MHCFSFRHPQLVLGRDREKGRRSLGTQLRRGEFTLPAGRVAVTLGVQILSPLDRAVPVPLSKPREEASGFVVE
jgi:hypothetical protein